MLRCELCSSTKRSLQDPPALLLNLVSLLNICSKQARPCSSDVHPLGVLATREETAVLVGVEILQLIVLDIARDCLLYYGRRQRGPICTYRGQNTHPLSVTIFSSSSISITLESPLGEDPTCLLAYPHHEALFIDVVHILGSNAMFFNELTQTVEMQLVAIPRVGFMACKVVELIAVQFIPVSG